MFCAAVQAGPGRLVGAGTMLSGSIPFALMRGWPLPDAYAVERMRRDRQDQLPGEPQRSIFSQLGLARYAAPLSLSSGRRRNALVTLPRPAPLSPPKINPKAIPIATLSKAKPKTSPVAMLTTIPKPARSVGLDSLSRSVVVFDNWFHLYFLRSATIATCAASSGLTCRSSSARYFHLGQVSSTAAETTPFDDGASGPGGSAHRSPSSRVITSTPEGAPERHI